MSCITQILQRKDADGMVRIWEKDQLVLISEAGGEYRGYEYITVFTDMGHRCGYVAIGALHPLNDTGNTAADSYIGEDPVDVHGGITFSSRSHLLKDAFGIACNDLWLGFDCAHCYDAADIDLVRKLYGKNNETIKFYDAYPQYRISRDLGSVHRDLDYVVAECKRMIDQLIELEKAA